MIRHHAMILALFALAACGDGATPNDRSGARPTLPDVTSRPLTPESTAASAPADVPGPKRPPASTGEQPIGCDREIGEVAAERLVSQCLNVSPATRPPCNAANSCALIEDEIARGCVFVGDDAAAAGCPPLGGVDAAAAALRRYYAAISAHDYSTAYSLWRDEGRASGQTPDAFARGFADTTQVRVALGDPGRVEGAAGSRFVRLPVTVTATLRDGTRQRFTGAYTLRRTAGPGASVQDRRWRLSAATLTRG